MITASDLLASLKRRGVRLSLTRRNRLHTNRTVSVADRALIDAHRDPLTALLRHRIDDRLDFTRATSELEALGLVKLENDRWTHVLGDDYMRAVLLGEIAEETAQREAAARATRARRMPITQERTL